MNDSTPTHLPEGFRPVELDWTELDSVDWNVTSLLQGTVLAGRYIFIQQEHVSFPTAALKIRTDDGEMVLWETARLFEFMSKLKPGDEVYIQHSGKKKLAGGRSMHLFSAAVKPHPERNSRPFALGSRPEVRAARPATDGRDNLPPKNEPAQTELPFDDDIPF